MEVLSVKDLNFRYVSRDTEENPFVLKDISFRADKGELILLCGPCGCGKTTLLKLLKEEIQPAGELTGLITNRYKREQTGFLFQNPESQIVCQTVEEELVFGAENMGMSRSEMARAAAELAAYLGIEKILHANTSELSGGQKQILNLAALLMMKPQILLLDEPVSQLDPVCTWEFMNLLKKVREDFNLTILAAEHNLDVFLKEADRVLYMEGGRIAYEGPGGTFPEKMLEEKRNFACSLPETIKIYRRLGGVSGWPFTPAELLRKITASQAECLCREDAEKNTREEEGEEQESISVKAGYFRYEKGGTDILKNLDLSLKKGKIYGLIGGNGAGKSTLFSVLSGYRRLYRGKCRAAGNTGVLPQNPSYAFYQDRLLEDYRMVAEPEKIEELLSAYEFFGDIREWMEKNPLDLSGGQMQKAAIFKMLLKDPEILLMDEPVKAMDGYEKELFLQMLVRLRQMGKTIFFISHDLEFVQRAADECLFLFDGRISVREECGTMFVNNRFYTTVMGRIRGIVESDESFINNHL